jgi:hypothetical protein
MEHGGFADTAHRAPETQWLSRKAIKEKAVKIRVHPCVSVFTRVLLKARI